MYNHCCFVYITGTIIAVLCILQVQSWLFCVYYMYNHCCFVYITCTIIAVLCILLVQSLLFWDQYDDQGNLVIGQIVLRGQNDRAIKVLLIYDSLVNYCKLFDCPDESFTIYFLHHIGPEGFRKLYLPGWACPCQYLFISFLE